MPSPLVSTKIAEFMQLADMAFNKSLEGQTAQAQLWKQFTTEVPSATRSNVYPWMAKTTGINKWEGDRIIQTATARTYQLENETFEGTIGFDMNDVADDQLDIYSKPLEQLAQDVAEFPLFKLTEKIVAGNSTVCWDNQFFFDVDHPVDIDDASKGTQSNNLIGAGYNLAADPIAAFKAVRAAQRRWKRTDGRRTGYLGNLIIVGPDLEEPARQIEQAFNVVKVVKNVAASENVAATSTENIFKGEVSVMVLDELDASAWYLADVRKPIKPMLLQTRTPPQFDILGNRDHANVFNRRQLLAGVDFRMGFGYTFPGLMFRAAAS